MIDRDLATTTESSPTPRVDAPEDVPAQSRNGVGIAIGVICGLVVSVAVFIGAVAAAPIVVPVAVIVLLASLFVAAGFYLIQPNQAAVLTFFGEYRGTDTTPGLRWANPLLSSRRVSQRVRNFTTATSKVNDARGNPIEIAAVVVWRIDDAARSVFAVDEIESYVETQSEAAVRHLARSYPYDAFNDDEITTLIGDTQAVNEALLIELRARAANAGVDVLETRLTDLSYATEIAEAMLRRQQAAAIVAARAEIVDGAVSMVQDALHALENPGDGSDAITLDQGHRATFAANLMTVIVSEAPAHPVVNVGTLNR